MIGIVVDHLINGIDEDTIVGPLVVVIDESTGTITSINFGDGSNLHDINLIRFPPGATLLPGYIDCHVHLTIFEDDYQLDHLRLSSASKALRALKAAQGLLQAGFTTVRSAGDADVYFPSFAVAKSIEKGEFTGPRIVGAGHYISVTGGGGDINFFAADSCPCCNADGVIADGKDQMILAVRKEIKYGSDWIKLLATGAFMSASTGAQDSPENTHMSEEEIRACVEEANRRQVHVMAHAHGADGIAKAANAGEATLQPITSRCRTRTYCHARYDAVAGCRSIEHASYIDAAGIEACLRNGTWIVPTFMIGEYYDSAGSKTGAQDRMIQLAQQTRERYCTCSSAPQSAWPGLVP